jgi:hypothetical protein
MFAIFAEDGLARRMIGRASGVRPMRTLRQIQGQIRVLPLRNMQSWSISVILGAYLSLQLVAPGYIAG